MAKTEKLSTYYQPHRDGDLKALLVRLTTKRGSRFEGRSMSEIVRMLLVEKLEEELKRQEEM